MPKARKPNLIDRHQQCRNQERGEEEIRPQALPPVRAVQAEAQRQQCDAQHEADFRDPAGTLREQGPRLINAVQPERLHLRRQIRQRVRQALRPHQQQNSSACRANT